LFKQILAVFYKEISIELRSRYALSTSALFILSCVALIAFNLPGVEKSYTVVSVLIWIIMFFSGMTILARTFIGEEEKGTTLLLRLSSSTDAIYFGKLLYNILLSLITALISALLYLFFDDTVVNVAYIPVLLSLTLGALGMASVITIISALISKANAKGALLPALSFPAMLPLILEGATVTAKAFSAREVDINDAFFLLSYSGVLISVSYILFPYIWED